MTLNRVLMLVLGGAVLYAGACIAIGEWVFGPVGVLYGEIFGIVTGIPLGLLGGWLIVKTAEA